jgi:hypothetical protein
LIYVIAQQKWVKIHSDTNEVYDASPTLKQQIEESPTILDQKRKSKQKYNSFKLGVRTVSCCDDIKQLNETTNSFGYRNKVVKTQMAETTSDLKKKMTVVQ